MIMFDLNKVDFSKSSDGLIPAIVQDSCSAKVLMLGYMNFEAVAQTQSTKKVTFYSRSKDRLWVKGEESKNHLELVSMSLDCDFDSILIQARPLGPTCHSGDISCFHDDKGAEISILGKLVTLLNERRDNPKELSYSSKLLSEPIARAAQKVGEEGVEVALAAVVENDQDFIGEVADLWFHSLVLLTKRKIELSEVLKILIERNSKL